MYTKIPNTRLWWCKRRGQTGVGCVTCKRGEVIFKKKMV